ncbi:MAG: putative O-glycosylation ligase, exosortase A system-associated [Alphaproteobacteria bacterium]|nr:putative O-glycosylation ligase, exosortase A system-associated [Alphaproteobacteria bacterium]
MRAYVLMIALVGLIPTAFFMPHVGLLVWEWISFMNPHREVFGAVGNFRLVLVMAIVTSLSWALSREPVKIPINRTTVLIGLFIFWVTVTTITAMVPAISWPIWERTIKTLFLLLFIIGLINNRTRIHAFIWVAAISISYFSIEGSAAWVLSGGRHHHSGPPGTMITDNNHLALALVITVPLLNYLRLTSEQKFVRFSLVAVMALVVVTVIVTYSRGGLIGMGAMLFYLWWRGKKKVLGAIVAALLLVPAVSLMPDSWGDRMGTIKTADKDSSFQGRLEVWEVSFRIANDHPLVGGGFSVTESFDVFRRYVPEAERSRAPHSIYFELLGQHGFIGIGIYMMLVLVAWRNGNWIIRNARNRPEMTWAGQLAAMIHVSMVGFFVAGAAVNLAYYDLALSLLAILSCVRTILARSIAAENPESPLGLERPVHARHLPAKSIRP